MLRQLLEAASRSARIESFAKDSGAVRAIVRRYIAGETVEDAVRAARAVAGQGLRITLVHLGEDAVSPSRAEAEVQTHLALLDRLAAAGLADGADISLNLPAFGLRLSETLAARGVSDVCATAARLNATVTVDPEEYTLIEPALALVDRLRKEYPWLGVVVRAQLRDAEDHCRALAGPGSRVRLCKGVHRAPEVNAFTSPRDVDRSFVRCLKILMTGRGHPMIATHDRRLIEIASALAVFNEREPDSFEYQARYGVRPADQRRMADLGAPPRVCLPYGRNWYAYLARRLADHPAGLLFAARALLPG